METGDQTNILWHGRGGQGAFTASRVLGAAYVLGEGGDALAFPSFGPERRGAPMRAFTKLSKDGVSDRSEITDPDFEVFLDEGLFRSPSGHGWTIIDSPSESVDGNVLRIDGTGIAKEVTGAPISNVVMAGAVAALWGGISPESLEKGITSVLPERLCRKNIEASRVAFERIGELIG